MVDVTRVLVGLDEFEMTGAVECAAGGLEVSVRVVPMRRVRGAERSAVV